MAYLLKHLIFTVKVIQALNYFMVSNFLMFFPQNNGKCVLFANIKEILKSKFDCDLMHDIIKF